MPKPDKHKRPKDVNQLAHRLISESTDEDQQVLRPSKAQISMLMAQMGRKGGLKGGKRRLETMTAKERSELAKKAAKARWQKKSKG